MDSKQWEVDDTNKLTAKVSGILKRHNEVREQYISKQECQVINELKKDDTLMILQADKEKVTVMNKSEYQKFFY